MVHLMPLSAHILLRNTCSVFNDSAHMLHAQVCVVDKRLIQGRTQEWNISRGELEVCEVAGRSCHASKYEAS
jgi:hypothetical protein